MGIFDITLRHVVQHRPEELVQGLSPAAASVEIVGWIDTQLTALERRLDKALELRIGGERRILCPEFQLDFEADVPFRVYAYQALLSIALHNQSKAIPPPIDAVVFVLRGREEPWPPIVEHRRGWPESAWSGVRFRVEAVYQRTVEELWARGGAFWLVFAPLARDATPEALRRVVEAIRQRVVHEGERAEIYAALLVMASVDPWGHNLRQEIETMLDAADLEVLRSIPVFRDALDRREKQAIEELLRELFARRMGRALTAAEQQALAKRAEVLGRERVEDALFRLEGDALAAWLLDPSAS